MRSGTIFNDNCRANVHYRRIYSFSLQIIIYILSETNSCLHIPVHAIATIMRGCRRYASQLSISNDRWLMSHGNGSHLLPASSISERDMSRWILVHFCQIHHHPRNFITPFLSEMRPHIKHLTIWDPFEYRIKRLTIRLRKVSLTHWTRVMHISVDKLTIIGSDNGLSPGRRHVIIWTSAGML